MQCMLCVCVGCRRVCFEKLRPKRHYSIYNRIEVCSMHLNRQCADCVHTRLKITQYIKET